MSCWCTRISRIIRNKVIIVQTNYGLRTIVSVVGVCIAIIKKVYWVWQYSRIYKCKWHFITIVLVLGCFKMVFFNSCDFLQVVVYSHQSRRWRLPRQRSWPRGWRPWWAPSPAVLPCPPAHCATSSKRPSPANMYVPGFLMHGLKFSGFFRVYGLIYSRRIDTQPVL